MRNAAVVSALLLLAGTALAADPPDVPPAPSAILAEIAEYSKLHPLDRAGLRDRCLDARVKLAPESYEYAVVTKRIADLDQVVGAAYTAIRPSAGAAKLPDASGKQKLAFSLQRDLRSRSPGVKRTAIFYLGRLGSETCVPSLARELARTQHAGVRAALVTALTQIGGPTVGRRLGEKLPMAAVPAQSAALDILARLVEVSDAEEDRRASKAIGEFIFSRDPFVAERAIEILAGAGEAGVWGLERGAENPDHQLRLLVIAALGATGSGRAAGVCARFLEQGRGSRSGEAEYAREAMLSIVQIGRPAVPYLSPFLQDSRRRRPARQCLYQITGRYFARQDEVAAWWSPHLRKKSKL